MRVVSLAVLYFVCGHVSFLPLVDNVIVTPVLFVPEGIALAFGLCYGPGVWPGVFIGQLALALSRGLPPWPSLGIATSNAMVTAMAAWLFHRLGLDVRLRRARDLAGLMLLIFLVLQPVGATLGHAALWAGGVIDRLQDSGGSWLNWWIGNALGQMIVTPLLLMLLTGQRGAREFAGDVLVSALAIVPGMAAVGALWDWTAIPSVAVALVPLVVLIAMYRGLAAVCVSGLIVALGTLYATGRGWGPFVAGPRAGVLDLNVFLVGLTLSGQFLSVFLRQLAESEAEHRHELETKLRTSLDAAAVAHEINQPLAAILLQARMALEADGDTRAALGVVAAEAQRVVVTIDKMKTLLRNVQTRHHPVDLAGVVRSALIYNEGLLARHGVTVHRSGLEDACMIMGDEGQLQVAVSNLLRNAAEAFPEGVADRREVDVELSGQRDTVELAIGDSGPGWTGGVPTDVPLTTTKRGGTGMGLHVVRTAVQNHRGTVAFGRSRLGGAEVRLTFPRAARAAAAAPGP